MSIDTLYALGYTDRAALDDLREHPRHHTTACLNASVDAFCGDRPEPGCVCGHDARIPAIVERRLGLVSDLRYAA